MVALRRFALFTINQGKETIYLKNVRPLLSAPPPIMLGSDRGAHSQQITKSIRYMSNDKVKLKVDINTMMLNKRIQNPLCIIMNWMMASPKHIQKYADLYLDNGFDVISVSCTPWQLLWPARGSQMIGRELLKFLESNDHKPLVVHGFSVGAYVWAEMLVRANHDLNRYQPVLDRIVAQVWDSPADIYEIPVGFPSAVFPQNMFLQETFRSYIKRHMKVFHELATKHYMKATEMYHATPCRAPGLFLVSNTDPVGAAKRSRHAHDCWVKMGMKCNFKCWDKSPHVSHYIFHPEEYRETLFAHLHECGLLRHDSAKEQPERLQAKL